MTDVDYSGAQWAPSPNYWGDRAGHEAQYIVMHGTAGSYPGCLAWLDDPASGASVHYLVDRAGHVHQLVREDCAAWGNGIPEPDSIFVGGINPNLISISIEHERPDAGNATPLTPVQQAASTALVADIRRRHGPLPLIGHCVISPQSRAHCPGPGFPLSEIDHAAAMTGPAGIHWQAFTARPTRVPLVFYASAGFGRPLYTSAAQKGTPLLFDAWQDGPAVRDVVTDLPDRRWYHRHNPHGQQGWTPSGWVDGNAAGSHP